MSETHVFAVAVETYQDTTIPNVTYAENDASAFVDAMKELGVSDSNIELLQSASATKTTLESKLRAFVSHVAEGDRVIFFYAGHGVAFNDEAFVTAYDTQITDPQPTSVPLRWVLDQLRECKSEQVLLFIDSCHSGLPIADGMRSIYSNFSDTELKDFCLDSEYHVAFASCGIKESSFSSRLLKHGVWSHSIIEALRGEAPHAFDRPGIITGTSLQGFIAKEVPVNLRKAFTKKVAQTPCVFGNFTKEFIVADLSELLERRRTESADAAGILKEANLLKERKGRVSELYGFSKGHKEPTYYSDATSSFVERVGTDDVKELAEEIHEEVRDTFSYKRRELDFSIDGAGASVRAPEFDVDINLVQDETEPGEYVLSTKVSILEPAILADDRFLELFSSFCDTVVFELSTSIDVQEKIDLIEDQDSLRPHLEYDAECTYLELSLADIGVNLCVEPYKISFSLQGGSDLGRLLEGTQSAIGTLGGADIKLLESSE